MVTIRPSTLQDEAYVASTWRDNFRDSALAHSLGDSVYNTRWTLIIQRLLSRCICMIAYDDDAPDLIIGFSVFEYIGERDALLHYVYVRYPQRRARVATDMLTLISDRRITYTHRTAASQIYTSEHPEPRWTYDFTQIWRHDE